MASTASIAGQADYRELAFTRLFDAPREMVFKAWTDPEQLARWWGPKDCTAPSVTLDARPGGAWRIGMRSADGSDHCTGGVFREVVEPERLVFTFIWDGQHGEPTNEMLVTVIFAEERGKTRLTFRQAPFLKHDDRLSHRGGWEESFDKLVAVLASAAPERG
jgi:uncharacterized protein YndB with AHSA1/START domain